MAEGDKEIHNEQKLDVFARAFAEEAVLDSHPPTRSGRRRSNVQQDLQARGSGASTSNFAA